MGILYILSNVVLLTFLAIVLGFFSIPLLILGSYTILINNIPYYARN